MNKSLFLILLTSILVVSCRAPFDPDIDTNKKVLVVDAFLTNKAQSNYVKLSMALPYDSTRNAEGIRNANVYVTDNTDTIIYYKETKAGYYEPTDTLFAGIVNRTYTLTVILPNGDQYNSRPQLLLPMLNSDSVYGGFNREENLVIDVYGNVTKVVSDICEVYYDIKSDNDEMPRFRFTSTQLIEYTLYYKLTPHPPGSFKMGVMFYCWMSEYDNSLRFTNEKYAISSIDIKKQTVCKTTADRVIYVRAMDTLTLNYRYFIIRGNESNRIISINQYRLNADAYRFYKGVEKQSKAEGKIFDPIISQLYGNIKCKLDSTKLVFGFFEVSSVSTNSYSVRRNGLDKPIVIIKAAPNFPTPEGFWVDEMPDFWINL